MIIVFFFGDQHASDRLNFNQIKTILEDLRNISSVEWVFFEGGEPFLLFPLLLKSVHRARQLGFEVGVVTNGFFARSEESARHYLRPLLELGLTRLYVSDDLFHYNSLRDTPAKRAINAARNLGLPVSRASINLPGSKRYGLPDFNESIPYTMQNVMFSGRSVEKIVPGVPISCVTTYNECPLANYVEPGTAYIDSYGFVQLCHGVAIGNAWEIPFSNLINQYDPAAHPIWGPLLQGGPAKLCQEYGFRLPGEYVDACHLCYTTRSGLIERFPQILAPRQVYGLPRIKQAPNHT